MYKWSLIHSIIPPTPTHSCTGINISMVPTLLPHVEKYYGLYPFINPMTPNSLYGTDSQYIHLLDRVT